MVPPAHKKFFELVGSDAELTSRGAKRTLWQIGACDGEFLAFSGTTDDPIRSVIGKPNVQTMLIEPNPEMYEKLQINIQGAFGTTTEIKAWNVAVCPNSSGTVPFYVVSPKLGIDHPNLPHMFLYQLSSFSREHILKHLDPNSSYRQKTNPHLRELFRKVIPNASYLQEIIHEILVPCKTPGDLLNESKTSPAVVDILMVDAEGYDAQIVTAFMDIPTFRPLVLFFETKHIENVEIINLQTMLERMAYKIIDDGTNAVAWRT